VAYSSAAADLARAQAVYSQCMHKMSVVYDKLMYGKTFIISDGSLMNRQRTGGKLRMHPVWNAKPDPFTCMCCGDKSDIIPFTSRALKSSFGTFQWVGCGTKTACMVEMHRSIMRYTEMYTSVFYQPKGLGINSEFIIRLRRSPTATVDFLVSNMWVCVAPNGPPFVLLQFKGQPSGIAVLLSHFLLVVRVVVLPIPQQFVSPKSRRLHELFLPMDSFIVVDDSKTVRPRLSNICKSFMAVKTSTFANSPGYTATEPVPQLWNGAGFRWLPIDCTPNTHCIASATDDECKQARIIGCATTPIGFPPDLLPNGILSASFGNSPYNEPIEFVHMNGQTSAVASPPPSQVISPSSKPFTEMDTSAIFG